MPDVAHVLKQEMKRIAAKEVRASGLAPKVRALSRRVRELEKRLRALEARPAPAPVQYTAAAPVSLGKAFKATPAGIRKIRATLKLTQAGLASQLGVSHSAVYQWEAGRMKPGPKPTAALQALAGQHPAAASQPAMEVAPPAKMGRRFKATPAVIKRVRAKIGVTQAELAILLGVSHSAVAKWEAGRIGPRPETAATLQALEGIGKREARRRLSAK
jgi:DNA-binding transcriptional regulator YiaG